MAVQAKTLKRRERYIHGSAVSAEHSISRPTIGLTNVTMSQRRVPQAEAESRPVRKAQQKAPSVSLFAIVGFFAVASLMIFVMLAQVNYNEILRETARLHTHMDMLTEQHRIMSIAFESAINMDEIERYARDVLGMSKPESAQITVFRFQQPDRVEVITHESDTVWWRELGGYLVFLFDSYIR